MSNHITASRHQNALTHLERQHGILPFFTFSKKLLQMIVKNICISQYLNFLLKAEGNASVPQFPILEVDLVTK